MAGRVLGDAIPEEDANLEQAENEEGHQEDHSTTTGTPSTAASSIYESPMTSVTLAADGFGFLRDPKTGESQGIVRRYTWSNGNKMSAQVISYGATITSIKIPDRAGTPEDIVMGYDNMDGYTSTDNPYFGATIGRVTNRIGDSSFTLNGRLYQLTANRGKDHLHGGLKGFDKVLWKSHVIGNKVVMTHLSKDGTEGYPGNLMVSVTFELTGDNKFIIDFQATCDKPTPINLTNHSYFNLAGHGAGPGELYNHLVTLNSDKFTTVDPDSIPTGKFRFVGGTIYDLRVPRGLGGMLKHVSGGGYDLNFCVTKASEQAITFVARALHPDSGRVLEVYSDQPGVQFYTGNNLPDPDGNILPIDIYEDPSILEAVVYDSAVCREEITPDEQYFMTDGGSEDLGTFSTFTESKSSSDKTKGGIGASPYVPELEVIRESKETIEESVKEAEEEKIEEEEEEIQEEEEEIIEESIEEIVEPKESKEGPMACEPECYCDFDYQCGFFTNSPATTTIPDTLTFSDKPDSIAASSSTIESSVHEDKHSGSGEGPGELDLKSQSFESEGFTRTSAHSSSSKKSQTISSSVPSQPSVSTEKASAAEVVTEEAVTEEVVRDTCLNKYKSCEAHFMDVLEMEMPDYGPTTQSGLGPYHEEIRGKMGARYRRHGGMCFETQKYPDSVNHQNFPSTILYPGHVYKHKIIYKFGVQFGFDQYLLQAKSTNSALATLSM